MTRHRFVRTRNTGRVTATSKPLGAAFSVNGQLQALTKSAPATADRSTGYSPIQIGKPLIIRYKYFNLRVGDVSNDLDRILISTYLKTEETQMAAAEAITYFDPDVQSKAAQGLYTLENFGAKNYGHEAIYYTKSYTGHPVRTTLQVYELDRADKKLFDSLKTATRRASNLPVFREYLPVLAMAERGVDAFRSIINWIDKDDPVIAGDSLDLFFKTPNSQILQSGRIVVVHGLSDDELINGDYALLDDNRLVKGNEEVRDKTYYVTQINQERIPALEGFDRFQGAAEILNQVNRGGGMADLVTTIADMSGAYSDIEVLRELDSLKYELDDPDQAARAKALVKGLSPDVRSYTAPWVEELLKEAD